MFRIYGRVLVKETDWGVPNLVVAAFDEDAAAPTHGVENPVPFALSVGAAAIPTGALDRLGDRLGSVLTDANGNFEIVFEDDAFLPEPTKTGGRYPKPDLVLAVFSPEEPGANRFSAPAEQRILCLSRFPRTDAGRIEAYVFRLPASLLEERGIAFGSGQPSQEVVGHADRLASAVQQVWDRADVFKKLKPSADALLEKSRLVAAEAKTKFSNISAVPAALREHELFAPRSSTVEAAVEIHTKAIQLGLDRIAPPGSFPDKQGYQGQLRLRMTAPELNFAGITLNNAGMVVGAVDPHKLLSLLTENRGAGVDLIRVRSLVDTVVQPADQLTNITTPAENPPVVPPENAPPGLDVTEDQARTLILNRIAGQLQDLEAASKDKIEQRPEAKDVVENVQALSLTGGPADVIAFHDVQVLQLAFKHVWTEAFSGDLQDQAEELYQEAVKHYGKMDQTIPDYATFEDVATLNDFISKLQRETGLEGKDPGGIASPIADILGTLFGGSSSSSGAVSTPIPEEVTSSFPEVTQAVWKMLSDGQQLVIHDEALKVRAARDSLSAMIAQKRESRKVIDAIISHPEGAGGRLSQIMYEIGQSLSEPYSFDLFEPNSYNYGILITYRQKWEPLAYQVGDLVSTIPLAPGENRKYSKKRVVKETRAQKQSDKSSSFESSQRSETERAEAVIMKKVSLATNFKQTASGSVNIGIADFKGSTEFALNQNQESSTNKKDFHEATIKASEEYRKEHSLEIDTTSSIETEDVNSGEISNPNNEITVTYMFYELQRRYRISEQVHRGRAVILVAQDVPSPHEIDEAWLIEYQWILARALLDESLRPALDYLTSGFAGDEVSNEVLRASWQAQTTVLESLEKKVILQMNMRDALRGAIVDTTLEEDKAKAADSALTGGLFGSITTGLFGDPGQTAVEMLEAQRKAIKARLEYAQSDLDDMQRKLQAASDSYQKATQEYAAAMQRKYSRRIAIAQLRMHVKQNILYYMQAIWDHEPPDQRFFRLYNKKVVFPKPAEDCFITPDATPISSPFKVGAAGAVNVGFRILCPPVIDDPVDLVDVADLDNPLGYKGNYIIFPLKQPCYLTSYMLREYVDDFFGIRDPDELSDHSIAEVAAYITQVWHRPETTDDDRKALGDLFVAMLTAPRRSSDEIIVATGQLFIEALPGRHPLLEDFKLRHRLEDIRKVQSEVRHAEMENLRLAARLVAGERQDPEIEKRIVVDKDVNVVVDSNP
jgi:hypothetical protein